VLLFLFEKKKKKKRKKERKKSHTLCPGSWDLSFMMQNFNPSLA
jgi:hypothetical protein